MASCDGFIPAMARSRDGLMLTVTVDRSRDGFMKGASVRRMYLHALVNGGGRILGKFYLVLGGQLHKYAIPCCNVAQAHLLVDLGCWLQVGGWTSRSLEYGV